VVKRWFDEIDGETPPIARETRALPKEINCIVPAWSLLIRALSLRFGLTRGWFADTI
jgi:hypothetical protein